VGSHFFSVSIIWISEEIMEMFCKSGTSGYITLGAVRTVLYGCDKKVVSYCNKQAIKLGMSSLLRRIVGMKLQDKENSPK